MLGDTQTQLFTAVYYTVSILVGIQLIFFVEAHTMLCVGFLMKMMVITHWCFQLLQSSAYTESRNSQLLTLPCQLGEVAAGTADPNWQRDIPTKWCRGQQYKLSKEGGSVGMIRAMAFVFPRNPYMWGGLLSWGWLNTCLPVGSSKWFLVWLCWCMWLLFT